MGELARLLRWHREALALSQEELAGLVEPAVSVATIGNVERGRTRPYRHTLDALAAALRLDEAQRAELLAAWRAHGAMTAEPDPPAARAAPARRHNLPAELTSFVGRAQELARVEELLAGTRLLTLTGAGGSGKTRLALRVAGHVLERYPEGAWLVELAPLGQAELVLPTVAAALGVSEEPGRPVLETLQNALAPRRMLLVLDNCEHLVTECARLADALLRACPALTILATSREVLGIAGETTWRVPSLSAPAPRERPSLAELAAYESVQLFVERARLVAPDFAPSAENAVALGQICSRLDGIPLAIELAAARTRVLSAEEIAGRLDDRFRLLTGGGRTALRRQQTLRALIDWSYDLLPETERALLRRLSAFTGGWTLEAAEAVATDRAEDVDVFEGLTSLVDKSLVVTDEPSGERRYRLLETVRQYAEEKLVEAGEARTVRGRHRDWCLALAEEAAAGMDGPRQRLWLDRLEREHENLRVALGWCLAVDETVAGLRLATALERFWYYRGHGPEAWAWLQDLLRLAGESPRVPELARARARALMVAHMLAVYRQEMELADRLIEEAIAEMRALGDDAGLGWALPRLAGWRARQQAHAEAHALWVEALELVRQRGDLPGTYQFGFNVALSAFTGGDLSGARAGWEECLTIARGLGQPSTIARAREWLANVALAEGELAAARTGYAEALALYHDAGDRYGIAHSVQGLGLVAVAQGEAEEAERLLRECLRTQREIVDQRWLPTTLDGLAGAAALRVATGGVGAAERALRLAGAAEAMREPFGGWRHPPETVVRRWLEPALPALGPEADSVYATGRAMGTEEAVALAMG